MKNRQSGIASVGIVILFLLVAGVVAFGASRVIGNSSEQSSNDTVVTSDGLPAVAAEDGSSEKLAASMILDTEVDQDAFYSVVLEDGSKYYGKVQGINDAYFRISPVYYSEGSVLKVLGSELHGPENAMYVNSSNVTSFGLLETGDVSTAITQSYELEKPAEVSDASTSSNIDDYIKDDLLQAVFFKDGTSYFAKLNSVEPLAFGDAVYQIETSEGSGTQLNISLALVPEIEVEPFSSNEILFWENLTEDGQISTAVSQYELSQ